MRKKSQKKSIISLFLMGVAVLAAGIFFWQLNSDPVSSQDRNSQEFVVTRGESVKSVALALAQKKLIRNWLVFILETKLLGAEGQIQAGSFKLSPSLSVSEIIKRLNHGTQDVWVTIPEGWRKEEIASRLENQLGLSAVTFLSTAQEGYLFPDTYAFPARATVSQIIKLMTDNFQQKVLTLNNLAFAPGKRFSGLSLKEVVILASLVERETKQPKDRSLVAGILIKRLQQDWPLEVDASLQYALGSADNGWWKKDLTADDLAVISPYNTRKNKGLPPAPISNPGLASLRAVFSPQESAYWFYLSDKNGNMHYAKTLEEHEANIKKYL